MKTILRVLCLGLCLVLAGPAVSGATDSSKKKTSGSSQSKSSSGKKSTTKGSSGSKKSTGKSKSKSKSKSKHESRENSAPAKAKEAAPAQGAGFRGLAWGSPLSVLKEPDLREEQGDMRYYTERGDDLAVLGVEMREIVYVFCHDKLAGVLTRYDGQINHLALLGKLKDTFGTPLESPPNIRGDQSWRFDSGGESIMMEYSTKATTGALAWMAKDQLAPCRQGGQ